MSMFHCTKVSIMDSVTGEACSIRGREGMHHESKFKKYEETS